MNRDQRIVVVVAFGILLAVAAVTVNRLLDNPDGGWFAYAPNTGVRFPSGTEPTWRRAAVWIGAVGIWVVSSLYLLRTGSEDD